MKNRLLSLLLSAVLLFTTEVPVYAAEADTPPEEGAKTSVSAEMEERSGTGEGAAGGEDAEDSPSTEPPGPPEDEWGGLAPANPSDGGKTSEDSEEPAVPGLEPGTVTAGTSLVRSRHIAYALGDGKAMASFNPWRKVTRAEAAVMLYRLLPDETAVSPAQFSDVPVNAWYANAASVMAALGVMRSGEAEFLPGEEITRGEFIHCLACFFPLRDDATQFPDVSVDSPDAPFIRSARAYGWTQGDKDGLFNPGNSITRAEAAVMVNRALGRTADREYIDRVHPAFYIDVSPETWFYYDVIEASVYHEHTSEEPEHSEERWTSHTARQNVPAPGYQLLNGWLFYYDSATGDLVRNGSVGSHAFDSYGRFTTGNAALDAKLRNIVLAKTNANMTQEQMLRALYVYTRDSFTYLRRPAYPFGTTDFMEEDALRMLNTGYGNCYCYAALFWYLSRWIGYESRIFNGTVGQNRAPHSWVEITMDGTSYIFDTELEMAYRRKKRYDVNLYKFQDLPNAWRYVRP